MQLSKLSGANISPDTTAGSAKLNGEPAVTRHGGALRHFAALDGDGELAGLDASHESCDQLRSAGYSALRTCRSLYSQARSFDALPDAQSALTAAIAIGDAELEQRALTASGVILCDLGDIAGAIEFHSRALHRATQQTNAIEASRTWNNIGSCFVASGNHDLAAACFRRSIQVVASTTTPLHSRFAAEANLALCHFHLGDIEAGLCEAYKALHEVTPDTEVNDIHSVLLLQRNLARLLLAANRLDDAGYHLSVVVRLTAATGSPRAAIACATVQAAYELAKGETDVALTRLAGALAEARKLPAVLRDTLACLAKAEYAAGHPKNARLRLLELSDHTYESAIAQARQNIELARILAGAGASTVLSGANAGQPRNMLEAPSRPTEWDALVRLGVSASLRVDRSGWHGIRVGTLVKALALEFGYAPIDALEIGLASQLHDIGMLSVTETIPLSARALNAVERRLVDRHSAAGAEILTIDSHPRWQLAKEIAQYHHARWDGKGNPRHVAGNAIPLTARMCAVADTYDSLVTPRPWRPACSMDVAMEELNRVANNQLDAELVRCFDSMIRRETIDLGIDPSLDPGLNGFETLITSLSQDRGFI